MKHHSPDQIAQILGEHAAGMPIATLTARYGIARSTVYRWRTRTAAAGSAHKLEHENRLLHRHVAELASDKALLQLLLRGER